MYYGYIRVSTKEQNEGRQFDALKEYADQQNMKYENIFLDKLSGKDFERSNYQLMKNTVAPGDKIIIKELDRLGRNYEEIQRELNYYDMKNIQVIILDLPVFNVDDPILKKMLSNLTINLLSYIAEKEREKIRDRVKEGLQRAKKEGKKLGRPTRSLPIDFEKYYKKWKAKEINAVEFSKLIGKSRSTLYRYINDKTKNNHLTP